VRNRLWGYPTAYANLNQMQLEVIKTFSQGFSFQVEYSWTRSLDTGGQYVLGTQQWRHPDRSYGNAWDVPLHNLTFNYVYNLPVGKNRRWLGNTNRAADAVLGGWEVSGITKYATGTPFSVEFQVPARYSNSWWKGRANTVYGVNPYVRQSGHDIGAGVRWINLAAFTAPAPGNWGDSAASCLWGPGMWNWDIGARKSFKMPCAEGHSLKFRADFMDTLNHMNRGFPGSMINTAGMTIGATQYGGADIPAAGKIFSGSGNRTIQLGLRYTF
jgi:hypothetical protein